MTRLPVAVVFGAALFAVAYAANAPLRLAFAVGTVSAVVAWRLQRNP